MKQFMIKKKLEVVASTFESEVAQLCLALCDPMDSSLPDFSIHGIFQARVLEWVDIPCLGVRNKT